MLLWCSSICHCQPPDWGYEKAAERMGAVGGGGLEWQREEGECEENAELCD